MDSPEQNKRRQTARYHISHDHVKDPVRFGELLLFQIGRTHCKEDTVIGKHAHLNLFELTVATDGIGSIFTNGKSVPVKGGDIFLSFPGDIHGITSSAEAPLKYDFCAFYPLDPTLINELEEIMRRIGISRSHFQRVYKELFSISCGDDVIRARIEKSKQLLVYTDLRIQEIALQCGYSNESHFMRQFKDKCGITATQFRKKRL